MVAPREGACIHDRIHISFLLHILRVGRSVGLYYIYYYNSQRWLWHASCSSPQQQAEKFQMLLNAIIHKTVDTAASCTEWKGEHKWWHAPRKRRTGMKFQMMRELKWRVKKHHVSELCWNYVSSSSTKVTVMKAILYILLAMIIIMINAVWYFYCICWSQAFYSITFYCCGTINQLTAMLKTLNVHHEYA